MARRATGAPKIIAGTGKQLRDTFSPAPVHQTLAKSPKKRGVTLFLYWPLIIKSEEIPLCRDIWFFLRFVLAKRTFGGQKPVYFCFCSRPLGFFAHLAQKCAFR